MSHAILFHSVCVCWPQNPVTFYYTHQADCLLFKWHIIYTASRSSPFVYLGSRKNKDFFFLEQNFLDNRNESDPTSLPPKAAKYHASVLSLCNRHRRYEKNTIPILSIFILFFYERAWESYKLNTIRDTLPV